MSNQLVPVFQQYFNADGDAEAGLVLHTYIAGTLNDKETFQTYAGTANTNPIVMNASGYPPAGIYGTGTYRLMLKDSEGTTLRDQDNVVLTEGLQPDADGNYVMPGNLDVQGELTINQKKVSYNSVADLQLDTTIPVGSIVTLLGYYAPGDSSQHTRIIAVADTGEGVSVGVNYANIVSNGTIDVRWTGAKGDNSTDDSSSIQKAIDLSPKILFSLGTYIIDSTLVFTGSDSYVISNGAILKRGSLIKMMDITCAFETSISIDGNILELDATNTTPLIQINKAASNTQKVRITNCKMQNSNSSFIHINNFDYDIDGELKRNLSIDNNQFTNSTAPAIIVDETTYFNISNNHFTYCYAGIVLVDSGNSQITNNRFLKVGNTAYTNQYLGLSGGKGCGIMQGTTTAPGQNTGKNLISHNTANHMRGRFIEMYQVTSLGALYTPNYILNNTLLSYLDDINTVTPDKIKIFGEVQCIMQNNTIEGQTANDITIQDSGAFTPSVIIKDNVWSLTGVTINDTSTGTVQILTNLTV